MGCISNRPLADPIDDGPNNSQADRPSVISQSDQPTSVEMFGPRLPNLDLSKYPIIAFGTNCQNGNEITFLGQSPAVSDDSKTEDEEYDTAFIYIITFDLKGTHEQRETEVDNKQYGIDLNDCSYCVDSKKVYLLSFPSDGSAKAADFYTIDLENKVIERICAVDIGDMNCPVVTVHDGIVYMFGSSENNAQTENVKFIPFDKTQIKNKSETAMIRDFGTKTQCLIVPESENDDEEEPMEILLMGGQTVMVYSDNEGNTQTMRGIPSDALWRCSEGEDGNMEWNPKGESLYFLPEPMYNFGAVLVKRRNGASYIMLFGGTKMTRMDNSCRIEESNFIHVMCIRKPSEMEDEEQSNGVVDENNDKWWLRLKDPDNKMKGNKLKEKGDCWAFVDEDHEMIHHISQRGTHTTYRVDGILAQLKSVSTHDNVSTNVSTYAKAKHWTEGGGKSVAPNKIHGLKTKGPNKRKRNPPQEVVPSDKGMGLEAKGPKVKVEE